MKLSFSAADEHFREEIAGWLADNLCRYRLGKSAILRGLITARRDLTT